MLTESFADTTAGRVSVSIGLPRDYDTTKVDEIELFDAFCAALPRWSYLASIFNGLRADVVQTIQNDWTTLERNTAAEIKRLTEQRDNVAQELKRRTEDLRRRVETAERAESKAQGLREELASIVSQIKRL